MKKRNILTIALAIALTAIISVGATMAYLTAQDDKVVNTFTFADNMEVQVSEPEPTPTGDEDVTSDPTGIRYDNIVPNQKLDKSPRISTKTTVDSYVFVRVTGASDLVQPEAILNGWTAISKGTADDHYNGVYYKKVEVTDPAPAGDVYKLLSIFDKVVVGNPDLFTEDKIVDGVVQKDENGNVIRVEHTLDTASIKIGAYEIQASGFADAYAAYAEVPDTWKTVTVGDTTYDFSTTNAA